MKHLVVLSGAGISAESGLNTFRDSNGLWEGYKIEEVATVGGWLSDREKVLSFYNKRRREAALASPNTAHKALANLEKSSRVSIITQNVDSLHERAGSTNVLHLHGQLDRAKSEFDQTYWVTIGSNDINIGDTCPNGYQMRPDVVWFGEEVPNMRTAVNIVEKADVFLIIGTSLAVYPAAGIVDYVRPEVPILYLDVAPLPPTLSKNVQHYRLKATEGIHLVISELQEKANL